MSISTRQDTEHPAKFAAVFKPVPGAEAPARPRRRIRWLRTLVISGFLVAGLALLATTVGSRLLGEKAVIGGYLTEPVQKADLVVSITEDGTVESSHNKEVKCEVQGGSTILWIIPDGTEVKRGDELVKLDSSGIQEKIDLQRIAYEKAKAIRIEAEKTFESNKIAVQEYIEGTVVQELQTLKVAATVAKENLESARNSLQFTNRMHRKGYVTTLQRDAQAFAVQRATLDLNVAETAITVLEKFTKPKMLVGLESARDAAEAKMASERAAFTLEEDRLKKLEAELEKCVVTAPDDGMVVYANENQERRGGGGTSSMVEEGAMMRERQTMLRLPDLSQMQVKCTIHESKIDSLERGMRAQISVQGRPFQGIVTSVANQPEAGNWFSGNVKEYAAIVTIQSDPAGLRPGQTASVEILVANLSDVLSVPVQAVKELGGKFYCWVDTPSGPVRKPVDLGLGNNTRMEVKSGLAMGDRVLLNPHNSVAEAQQEDHSQEKVDVHKKFGGDRKAAMPSLQTESVSRGGGAADGNSGVANNGAGSKGRKGAGGFDLMSYDADKDKKLSREEMPERLKAVFEKLDSNTDGFIDSKEVADARKAMQKMKSDGGGSSAAGGL